MRPPPKYLSRYSAPVSLCEYQQRKKNNIYLYQFVLGASERSACQCIFVRIKSSLRPLPQQPESSKMAKSHSHSHTHRHMLINSFPRARSSVHGHTSHICMAVLTPPPSVTNRMHKSHRGAECKRTAGRPILCMRSHVTLQWSAATRHHLFATPPPPSHAPTK